jgi:hypothetical protein
MYIDCRQMCVLNFAGQRKCGAFGTVVTSAVLCVVVIVRTVVLTTNTCTVWWGWQFDKRRYKFVLVNSHHHCANMCSSGKKCKWHPALATLIPTCTVYDETPVQKLQLFQTAFWPQSLLFYDTNWSTLNPCNPTELTLHVIKNCQHVSLIMLAKSNLASINLPVGALLLLRLHCYHQWNEDFECSLPQHCKLWQNRPARFNQTWIESVLSKWNLGISSQVKQLELQNSQGMLPWSRCVLQLSWPTVDLRLVGPRSWRADLTGAEA